MGEELYIFESNMVWETETNLDKSPDLIIETPSATEITDYEEQESSRKLRTALENWLGEMSLKRQIMKLGTRAIWVLYMK